MVNRYGKNVGKGIVGATALGLLAFPTPHGTPGLNTQNNLNQQYLKGKIGHMPLHIGPQAKSKSKLNA